MARMTHTQRVQKKRAQIRDIFYLLFLLLITVGIYNSLISPLFKKPVQVHAEETIVTPTLTPSRVFPTIFVSPTPVQVQFNDHRIKALETFLTNRQSPLADYAAYIVSVSDQNGIDWTLIAAIAGKESGYCHAMPYNSFNCWGLGGANNMMYFASYNDSIAYIANLLGHDYKYNSVAGIQQKYCPTSDCYTWANDVTEFSQEVLASN